MTKNMSTPEPDPVATEGPAVWDLVIGDMRERDQSGRAKYGVPLQAGNGRDALVDAYQEALDLAVYLRALMAEDWRGRALRAEAEVVELRARLASLRPPSVVEDFERFKQVTDARALLRERAWVETEPGEWSPAPALGWWIDITRSRCSPEILRALAILAEEAQS